MALHETKTDFSMSLTGKRTSVFTATAAIVCLSIFCISHTMIDTSVDGDLQDVVSVTDGLGDESSCIQCHSQATEFADTGHAKTLRRASSLDSKSLLSMLAEAEGAIAENTEIAERNGKLVAMTRSDDTQHELELDWCFGSGTHACTWVSTMPDSHGNTDVLEFRWTWFASTKGFALTPGQPKSKGDSCVSALGLLFDGPKARRCFSCHSTVLPVTHSQFDETKIRPGVTCQRCHGPREKHIQTDGAFHSPEWGPTDRMEAVRRCAVCHRLPEEKSPEEIVPDNPEIVRFQPMGLMQSACFLSSEMRCTTCHDPHRPMGQQDSGGIWQCIQCHNPEVATHTLCGLSKNDNCLDCHMPKVEVGFPVRFTDHWIRVRTPASETEQ